MKKDINWELILKILTKTATSKEWCYYNKWLKEDPQNKVLVDELKQHIRGDAEISDTLRDFNILAKRLQFPKRTIDKGRKKVYYNMAACFLLFAGISVAVALLWQQIKTDEHPLTYIETITERGSRLHMELEDGTTVWLNADSKIIYPEKFSKTTREVQLTGEAYFKVAKNARPFIVKTPHLETRVLGTSFNINAYENRESEDVTVLSGKVQLSRNKTEQDKTVEPALFLTAQEKGVFTKRSKTLEEILVSDSEESRAWTNGKLVFKQATMLEIMQILSRKFNVQVMADNSEIELCRVSAKFNDQPLLTTLNLLTDAVDIRYKVDGKIITLYGNGCN